MPKHGRSYAAFISYAHSDEAIAGRLHKAFETYPLPRSMSQEGRTKLSPIFRDTAELTAHHSLSEKIRDAVENSRCLIVLCSPAAKASHWVNEEIRLFRKLHGEAAILCVIVDGIPDTAFPPALTENGREPLAATLGDSREGFRLGVTQIAASLLGVGLDDLIQRDLRRRRRRLQAVTLGALAFSGIMGATAYTAVQARNDAQVNRAQAEDLVDYMITDLRGKLEPVGRLDILDGVGEKILDYYEQQDLSDLTDDSLALQARALHLRGQVDLQAGGIDEARIDIERAAELTKEILIRNPNDPDAIFAHAQSEFWVGKLYFDKGDYEGALPFWTTYRDLGIRLYKKDPSNIDWIMEAGWGENNLGSIALQLNQHDAALDWFEKASGYFGKVLLIDPDHSSALYSQADAYAGAARAAAVNSNVDQVRNYRLEQIKIYETMLAKDPQNFIVKFRIANVQFLIAKNLDFYKPDDDVAQYMRKPISYIEDLIVYEPDNKAWMLSRNKNKFYYLTLLSSQQEADTVAVFFKTYIDSIKSMWPNKNNQDILELAAINYFYYNGNQAKAKNLLNEVNRKYLSAGEAAGFDSITLRHLLDINAKFETTQQTENIAKKITKMDMKDSEARLPHNVFLKLKAYDQLGVCAQVRELYSSLTSRGYTPDLTKLKCSRI